MKFRAQGVIADKRVIDLVLHQLGHDDLTLYDGSIGEWAKDRSLPIETD